MKQHREFGRSLAGRIDAQIGAEIDLDDVFDTVLAAYPHEVQQAHRDESNLIAGERDRAGRILQEFSYATLAREAAFRIYTKRVLRIPISTDEANWHEFVEGVVEYATKGRSPESMDYLRTRAMVFSSIKGDPLVELCGHYAPEASPPLQRVAAEVKQIIARTLKTAASPHRT